MLPFLRRIKPFLQNDFRKASVRLLKSRGFYRAIVYGAVVWVGLSLIAYGQALSSWPSVIEREHIFTESGKRFRGKVTNIGRVGFGLFSDYLISIDDGPEYQIPSRLLLPVGEDDPYPKVALDVREGDEVSLITLSYSQPFVVSLAKIEGGTMRSVLNYDTSVWRIRKILPLVPDVGRTYRIAGLALIGFVLLFHYILRRIPAFVGRKAASGR